MGKSTTNRKFVGLADFFLHTHNNPPAPFNPDYNPETVARHKKYANELGAYQNSLPDDMPDEEFNRLVRVKQRELQRKHDIYVRLGCLPAEEIATMGYCIQCTDKKSGAVGDFVHYGDFRAVSPVFNSLVPFYEWLKNEGVTPRHDCRLEVARG